MTLSINTTITTAATNNNNPQGIGFIVPATSTYGRVVTTGDYRKLGYWAGLDDGPALQLCVEAGAAWRNNLRVEATLETALKAAGNRCRLTAAFLLTLDVRGVGGELGLGGASARMPWARGLGAGRWHAADGEAYKAASLQAVEKLYPKGQHLVAAPDMEGVWVGWSEENGMAHLTWAWFRSRGLCPWIEAELRRAILREFRNSGGHYRQKTGQEPEDCRVYLPETEGHIQWRAGLRALGVGLAVVTNQPTISVGGFVIHTDFSPTPGLVRTRRMREIIVGEEFDDVSPIGEELLGNEDTLALLGLAVFEGDDNPATSSKLEYF
jgi:hypothetical protein